LAVDAYDPSAGESAEGLRLLAIDAEADVIARDDWRVRIGLL
jgi:hypothetical protein